MSSEESDYQNKNYYKIVTNNEYMLTNIYFNQTETL